MPGYSPDGGIIVLRHGAASSIATLDTTATLGPTPVTVFPQYGFWTQPAARLSPDGTQLAFAARPPGQKKWNADLWITARNMSIPPQFTSANGQTLGDTDVVLPVTILEQHAFQMTVAAADPDTDRLTYWAAYLSRGMTFEPSTQVFSWTPASGTAGSTFPVKFVVTTASGGTDELIAAIAVVRTLRPGGPAAAGEVVRQATNGLFRNQFLIMAPGRFGTPVGLEIFDVRGRRLRRLLGSAGAQLIWDARDAAGQPMPAGIYFYKMESAETRRVGKFVLLR